MAGGDECRGGNKTIVTRLFKGDAIYVIV